MDLELPELPFALRTYGPDGHWTYEDGILSGPAIERLQASPIREVVATNTVPIPPDKQIDKLTVLSVASLIGETIQRIHTGASVSFTYNAIERVASLR